MHIADAQIATQSWLAGSQFTLADVAFGTLLFRYYTVPFQRAKLANLER